MFGLKRAQRVIDSALADLDSHTAMSFEYEYPENAVVWFDHPGDTQPRMPRQHWGQEDQTTE